MFVFKPAFFCVYFLVKFEVYDYTSLQHSVPTSFLYLFRSKMARWNRKCSRKIFLWGRFWDIHKKTFFALKKYMSSVYCKYLQLCWSDFKTFCICIFLYLCILCIMRVLVRFWAWSIFMHLFGNNYIFGKFFDFISFWL